jgi:hypothetical protein
LALRGVRLVAYATATVTPKKEKGKPIKAFLVKVRLFPAFLPRAQKASGFNRHMALAD